MTKKDELLNSLIVTTSKEVDYWLLEKNRPRLEMVYGSLTYSQIRKRMETLRSKLLKIVLAVPKAEDRDA